MPRDINGIYTLPAGNPVAPNTTISPTWANTTLQDIADALSQSLAVDGSVSPAKLSSDAAGFRTKLGLGTAATKNTGASGSTVPLCNGSNTWSAAQTFSLDVNVGGNLDITGSSNLGGATIKTGKNLSLVDGQFTGAKSSQDMATWSTAGIVSRGLTGSADAFIAFDVSGVRAGAIGITADNELSWKTNADGTSKYKVWTAKNFDPNTKQNALGFTPVRQGSVDSGTTNVVNIGWRTDGTIGLKIDSTEFYNVWPMNITGSAGSLGGVAASSYARRDSDNTFSGINTHNSPVYLDNGGNDAPEIHWKTYGTGAMTLEMDCLGSVFRTYVNGGTSFPFQFDCGVQSFKSFGSEVVRGVNFMASMAAQTAAVGVGAVGTYASVNNLTGMTVGATVSGANLRYSGSGGAGSGTLSGSWIVMGNPNGTFNAVRIA